MGKKKTVSGAETPGKTRVELRFDTEVFDGIKALADKAEISVNQLMHALAKWANHKLQVGEPIRDENGFIENVRPQAGCLWAGELGVWEPYTEKEIEEDQALGIDTRPGDTHKSDTRKGKTWLFIDYTERRVLRDDV